MGREQPGSPRAELVMVGTELLLGQIVDSNAAYLAQQLAGIGLNVYHKTTVGDNWTRIAEVLARALDRADVVITSGGLGPTDDDLTKEVLAAVMGRRLLLHEEALEALKGWYRRQNRDMSESNLKQVMLPEGAEPISNAIGTAPGVLLDAGNRVVVCLPGVPAEMRSMMEQTVIPYLRERFGQGAIIRSRTLRFCGIGEAALAERVRPLLQGSNPTVAPYAGSGEVKLRITARAESEEAALALIEPVQRELEQLAEPYLYGYDDDLLEDVVGRLLVAQNRTLAVAESCTGGLISHRLTNVPGSSRYFMEGLVTYSNEAKMQLLGVSPQTLESFGAVSRQTALEMAAGVRRRGGTDVGLASTGIAGPGGGSDEKPVGLVYLAVAVGERLWWRRLQLVGDRERIKMLSAQHALDGLRRVLQGRHLLDWQEAAIGGAAGPQGNGGAEAN